MTKRIAGPCGWLPDATPDDLSDQYRTSSIRQRQPARCDLHGINIVDRFPSRCPLATPNPLIAIEQVRGLGWRELGHEPGTAALDVLDRADVCFGCIVQLLRHRTVRRLRAESGVTL